MKYKCQSVKYKIGFVNESRLRLQLGRQRSAIIPDCVMEVDWPQSTNKS